MGNQLIDNIIRLIVNKIAEWLTPFETGNIINLVRHLSFATLLDSPVLISFLVVILYFTVIKQSKFVLLSLFTILSVTALITYTLPKSGEITMTSMLPFAAGSLLIGSVLIYFNFIRTE